MFIKRRMNIRKESDPCGKRDRFPRAIWEVKYKERQIVHTGEKKISNTVPHTILHYYYMPQPRNKQRRED